MGGSKRGSGALLGAGLLGLAGNGGTNSGLYDLLGRRFALGVRCKH